MKTYRVTSTTVERDQRIVNAKDEKQALDIYKGYGYDIEVPEQPEETLTHFNKTYTIEEVKPVEKTDVKEKEVVPAND